MAESKMRNNGLYRSLVAVAGEETARRAMLTLSPIYDLVEGKAFTLKPRDQIPLEHINSGLQFFTRQGLTGVRCISLPKIKGKLEEFIHIEFYQLLNNVVSGSPLEHDDVRTARVQAELKKLCKTLEQLIKRLFGDRISYIGDLRDVFSTVALCHSSLLEFYLGCIVMGGSVLQHVDYLEQWISISCHCLLCGCAKDGKLVIFTA
ncbi:MAG: hypothetical protein JWM56_1116 [Candidatus Peribacteria bacterium]|nr:hypothetical protein [Candidatus Peribacteria bacterium]